MKATWIVIAGVILLLLIFGVKFVSTRNEIVTQKEAITASWAQVDNVMQRRADLIPNLVETVKGYAKHEQTAIQDGRIIGRMLPTGNRPTFLQRLADEGVGLPESFFTKPA